MPMETPPPAPARVPPLAFEATVPAMIRALAATHGERELIVADGARLTYAAAEARSARLARALLAAGAGKGTRVALCFPNGPEWVVGWLAAARIGAIAVPVNTFFQAREMAWLLRHADVSILLCQARFLGHDYLAQLEEAAPELAGRGAPGPPGDPAGRGAPGPPGHPAGRGAPGPPGARAGALRAPSLPYLRAVWAWGGAGRPWAQAGERMAEGPDDPAVDEDFLRAVEAQVTPSDPMLILYSSGSSGDPKGAVHTQGGVLRHSYQLSWIRGVRPDDRIWSPMPFFWVGGLVFSLLGAMHHGACMLAEASFEPGRTLALLEQERATATVGWPHFAKALLEHPDLAKRDLSALRAGNLPGLLPPHVCPADPELRPNGLGMTETCGPHTYTGEGPLPESLRGAFGTAIPGVEHRIVDPESGARLGPGASGEICVRGYSLMQGLYKLEREEVFDREGFYHTGDLGRFTAQGMLYFEGRRGEMIKSGGANVTPSEVESVIAAFPEVKEAFVVGVADARRGEQVAAAVVPEAGAEIAPDEVRTRARAQLAAYKVPRHVVIAAHDELPFTATGKIDKRRLRDWLEARLAERGA
jgi:acyl-CoA synthetase (AMP-forming)/AMP-acid ligase II